MAPTELLRSELVTALQRVFFLLTLRCFFDRKPAAEKPWTEKLWIYDLRTNKHFTLKEWSSCDIDWRSVSPKGVALQC